MNKGSQPSKLTDVLDPAYLQEFQNGLAEVTRVTTVIIDADGNRVTTPSNWAGIRPLFHDSSAHHEQCRDTILEVVDSCRAGGRPVVAGCPHGGLVIAGVPIVIDGVFLGCWIFSHLQSPASLELTAQKLGMEKAAIEQSTAVLPLYSREGFNGLFQLVKAMTATMIELGREKLEMAKRDAELLRITRQLKKRDQVLTQYVEASPDAMYICDYDTGKTLVANRVLGELVGLGLGEIVGRSCRDWMCHMAQDACALCPREELLGGDNEPAAPQSREFFYKKRRQWLHLTHRAIAWASGWARMVTIRDITQEHSMRRQLKKLAYYDNLTGVPNNNSMAMHFRNCLKTYGTPNNYMVCVELSSLRAFSDAYGRELGNAILKSVVAWFQKEDFGDCEIFRIERTELCLLLGRDTDLDYAKSAARRIYTRFEKTWLVVMEGREVSYVCDIFLSILRIPDHITRFNDLQNLISRNFRNGRRAKAGIYLYDEDLDREMHEHLKLVLHLKRCVNQDMQGFSLEYQPITRLSTGLWSGVEALCRWTRPGKGPVPPQVFIPELESLGLINTHGLWTLETAVRQIKEAGLDAVEDFFLSVNLSPIQLMASDFVETVAGILARHQYPGNKLDLEILESAQVTFNTYTMNVIAELHAMGIRMALDDFGTGYSSIRNLKNLPVNFLKTEREFVVGIETDKHMQYVFSTMAKLAHASKMELIAEGVETAEQLNIAIKAGADFIQGYYFSKPLTAAGLNEKRDCFTAAGQSAVCHG